MAERKLRMDAAEPAVIPHPRMRLPEPDNTSAFSEPVFDGLATEPHDKQRLKNTAARHSEAGLVKSASDRSSELEHVVWQKLMSHPEVRISSLSIYQVEGGICLEGFLESSDGLPDIERLVRGVAGVENILNRLVLRPPDASLN
ncbi:MAG: BON domain-containing protein [Rhodopirellula sp.]|nr:BON domain-containing protein [Rhodopirellula sp.]